MVNKSRIPSTTVVLKKRLSRDVYCVFFTTKNELYERARESVRCRKSDFLFPAVNGENWWEAIVCFRVCFSICYEYAYFVCIRGWKEPCFIDWQKTFPFQKKKNKWVVFKNSLFAQISHTLRHYFWISIHFFQFQAIFYTENVCKTICMFFYSTIPFKNICKIYFF